MAVISLDARERLRSESRSLKLKFILLRPVGLIVVSSKTSDVVVRIMAAQATLVVYVKALYVLPDFGHCSLSYMFGMPVRLRQRPSAVNPDSDVMPAMWRRQSSSCCQCTLGKHLLKLSGDEERKRGRKGASRARGRGRGSDSGSGRGRGRGKGRVSSSGDQRARVGGRLLSEH